MQLKAGNIKLILGDCLLRLKELPDNSVDSIVTDPPYGLSFMGKKWDYDVPTTEIWEECLRVLKPGGHLLAFFGTRTYHRGVVRIEDAGFEIRDQIAWLYGQGFPKSHNLKGEHEGKGTALKPSIEPIVVARKPLEKGLTIAQNVMKWGTGALNIDGSRIGDFSNNTPSGLQRYREWSDLHTGQERPEKSAIVNQAQGRWPANVIFDEDAAKVLDEQSGHLKGGGQNYSSNAESMFGTNKKFSPSRFAGDSGGASRFFYVAKASKRERNAGCDLGVAKRSEYRPNDDGTKGIQSRLHGATEKIGNHHPTVKPVKLMEYLITLVTPPNGSALDPFMGSGTTGVAAKNLNRAFIGIELVEEYFAIAQNRIG